MGRKQSHRRATRARPRAIENRQKAVEVEMALLDAFLRKACREMGLRYPPASVCLVTDREMEQLNTRFRKKTSTTDVLSFPSEERPKPRGLRSATTALGDKFLGDIAISPTVARRNAKRAGRSTAEEMHVLLLHGILHLLGYDHENDRGEMDRLEAKLRRRLRLA